jgi:TIR domain
MATGAPPRIFLSYAHRDAADVAVSVRHHLEKQGYQVWQDKDGIRAAKGWTDEIRDGLRGSDSVVALLSPHGVRRSGAPGNPDNKDSVCLDEIEYAVDACQIPIVPVMVLPCEPPFRIFRLQYVDFQEWAVSASTQPLCWTDSPRCSVQRWQPRSALHVSGDACRSLGISGST